MRPRRPCPDRRRQRGQGTIEFQILGALVLIPLLLFVLQIGLLVMAKNTLNVATLGAARAGAASGGNHDAMNDALSIGLAPLYAGRAKQDTGVGMADVSAGNYLQVMGAAVVRSKIDNALWRRITVLNPTTKSFADFGVARPGGNVIIPVTGVYNNMAVGANSGQTRADALLLKIEVRYCHSMDIPIIREIITGFLNGVFSGASVEDRICYAADRMPLVSQAVVRMTVPPVRQALLR